VCGKPGRKAHAGHDYQRHSDAAIARQYYIKARESSDGTV